MKNPEILLADLEATDAWIRALARRLVRNDDDAEDVAQEAWIKLLTHRPDRHGPIGRWMATVLRNLATSRRRSESSRLGRERAAARPDAVPSVAELWDEEQLRRRVANSVFALEEPYRTAVLLRYFRGHPPREIAAQLEASPAAVETRLRRGLEKLRGLLDRDFGDRKTWCAALLPWLDAPASSLATPSGTGSLGSFLTGGLLMSLELKIGFAVVLIAAGAVVMWPRSEAPENPPIGEKEAAAGSAPADDRLAAGGDRGNPETRPAVAAAKEQPGPVTPPAAPARPSGSLRGRVSLIGGGDPCPDAIVRIFRRKPDRNLSRRYLGADADHETKTGQDGAYAIDSIPPGDYRIRIHPLQQPIAHTEKVEISIRDGETTTRDFEVGTGIRVRGVVKEKETEKPIAGIKVWHWENPRQVATTDEKGRFEIVGVEAQMLVTSSFDVDAPNHIRVRTKTLRLPSSNPHMTVLMSRGATISGRVIGPDGQGVPGARVIGDPGKTVTGEDGRFVLGRQDAARHVNTIRVAAKGFPRTDLKLEIATGEHKKGVIIRLKAGGTLRIRVANDQGAAVAAVRMRMFVGDSLMNSGKTGENGSAEISGVVPGTYELRVIPHGNLMCTVREKVIVRANAVTELEVVLRRGAELTGVVVDAIGRPVQGANITASSAAAYWDQRKAVTDENGRFRIMGLTPGTLRRVSATKRGFDTVWLEKDVSTGMSRLRITLNRILQLRGRVVHAGSQAPAKAFWIKLLTLERTEPRTQTGSGPRRYLPPQRFFTSQEGRFSTPVHDPGIYTIVAGTKAGERSRVAQVRIERGRKAEPVLMVLEKGATLHGQVLDELGKPAPSACLHDCTMPVEGRTVIERGTTDEHGKYRFTGLGPGAHLLRAFVPGRPDLEAAAFIQLGQGAESRVPLTLRLCGTLHVRVVDSSGQSVKRVAVLLRRVFNETAFPFNYLDCKHEKDLDGLSFFVTDADGRTAPRHLPPGIYQIKVTSRPKVPRKFRSLRLSAGIARRTVTIHPGRATRVEIRLNRP